MSKTKEWLMSSGYQQPDHLDDEYWFTQYQLSDRHNRKDGR